MFSFPDTWLLRYACEIPEPPIRRSALFSASHFAGLHAAVSNMLTCRLLARLLSVLILAFQQTTFSGEYTSTFCHHFLKEYNQTSFVDSSWLPEGANSFLYKSSPNEKISAVSLKVISPDKSLVFKPNNVDIFRISAWKYSCGYWLEAPYQGVCNEYPQHMFLWRNKEIIRIFGCKIVPYEWNSFYGHSIPSADSKRAVYSNWQKYMHKYWLTADRTKPAQEEVWIH